MVAASWRPDDAGSQQLPNDLFDQLIGAVQIGLDHHLWSDRFLIRCIDAGEIYDFAFECTCIHAFGIAAFADLKVAFYIDLEESSMRQ